MRLFLALSLPEEVGTCLQKACEQLAPQLPAMRWSRLDHYHLTLRFLGETAVESVPMIEGVMAEAALSCPPLSLQLDHWGAFANDRRARIVWAGITGDGIPSLHHLANELAKGLPTGEKKPFVSHITVARSSLPIALPSGWQERVPLVCPPWMAGEIHLYQSTLTPQGSRYTLLSRNQMGGGR